MTAALDGENLDFLNLMILKRALFSHEERRQGILQRLRYVLRPSGLTKPKTRTLLEVIMHIKRLEGRPSRLTEIEPIKQGLEMRLVELLLRTNPFYASYAGDVYCVEVWWTKNSRFSGKILLNGNHQSTLYANTLEELLQKVTSMYGDIQTRVNPLEYI